MRTEMAIGMTAGGLTGAGLLIAGIYQRNRLAASQGWPQATGTVTGGKIVSEYSNDSTGYSLALTYDYLVNGVRYTGKRIGFSRRSYSRKSRAQSELDRYPLNSGVIVYFNPEKPADAVLVRESPGSIILIIGGIALLGVVAAGLLWDFLHPAV
jgi:hypothetical protein